MKKLPLTPKVRQSRLEQENSREERSVGREIARIKRDYIRANGYPTIPSMTVSGLRSFYRILTKPPRV